MLGLMLLFTSCVAPEERRVARPPARITDPRELVRRLAPGASDEAIAALPSSTTGATPTAAAPTAAPTAAAPFDARPATLADADRARDCLTAAVYYEARSEPADGQRAVAQVVLNRVRDRAFPHSVCGVVYQGVGSGRGCQFSFACDGSTRRPREPDAWARAAQIATAALGGEVMAAVGNATFYHAGYMLPWWASSLTRLGAIGSHIFYRWPGAVERALGMGARYAGVEPGVPSGAVDSPAETAIAAGADYAETAVVRGAGWAVAVHRMAAASPPVTPAALRPEAPARVVRAAAIETVAGVRIHRGTDLSAEMPPDGT